MSINDNIEIAKKTKSDFIYFTLEGTIIRSDSGFYTLRNIYYGENYNIERKIFLDLKEIKTVELENVSLCNPFIQSKLYDMSFQFNNMISRSKVLYNIEDCRNAEFDKAISKKTKDGISFLKIDDEIIITLYKGLLPVNKSDKVSLTIYDYDESIFISKFIINKGKGLIVEEYMCCLKITK